MTDQLTVTGLELDTFEVRLARLKAAFRAAVAAHLNLAPERPVGQILHHFAEHAQQLAELLGEVFVAFDPDQATGISQDALCLLTGSRRLAASAGSVLLTLNLDALTTVFSGTTFAVLGDVTNQWTLDEDVTSVGAGDYPDLSATSTQTGVVQAPAGTITVIVTPVVGLNMVTNPADATVGRVRETHTELRLRREVEIALGGSTSTAAIHADLSAYGELVEVIVLENDLDYTVDGIPAHAIEVIYWDGVAAGADTGVIAETILDSKAGGIRAHGSAFVVIVDATGSSHSVGMTRAAGLVMELEYTLDTNPEDYPGDAAFQAAMADLDAVYQTIGADVLESRWLANAFSVAGVLDVSLFRLRFAGAAWGTIDLPVGTRQIATLSSVDVTVL